MGEPGRTLAGHAGSGERPHLRAVPRPNAAPRENITLADLAVATVSGDRNRVNNIRATSAEGMPAIEVLGGLASRDPTGVVLIGHGAEGLAFALESGRVVAAFGTGARGSMTEWAKTARAQDMQRWRSPRRGAGVEIVRMFIQRCVLERLVLATKVGSVLSVLRGDVEWIGSTLDASHAPSLHHLLMDHAREADDSALLERRLAPLNRLVVPITVPEAPTHPSPHLRAVEDEAECSFASLEDAPEPTSVEVLRAVWSLCDGNLSLDALANRSMFGRARTLRALCELRTHSCVELIPAPDNVSIVGETSTPALPPIDEAELKARYPNEQDRNAAVESFIGGAPSWLAELDEAAKSKDDDMCLQVCTALLEAADAVAAGPLLETVGTMMRAVHTGMDESFERHIETLHQRYAEAFRALLETHTG